MMLNSAVILLTLFSCIDGAQKYMANVLSPLSRKVVANISHDPKVVDVPETSRSYSSVFRNDAIGTGHARSTLNSPQGWSAGQNKAGEWMQMDLGTGRIVSGVVMQNRGDFWKKQCVTSFTVQVSGDGITFTDVEQFSSGCPKAYYTFRNAVSARYVRITVQSWQNSISLRTAVLVQSAPPTPAPPTPATAPPTPAPPTPATAPPTATTAAPTTTAPTTATAVAAAAASINYYSNGATSSYDDMKAKCGALGKRLCYFDEVCPEGGPNKSPAGGQQSDDNMWSPIQTSSSDASPNWVQVGTRDGGMCNLLTSYHAATEPGAWMVSRTNVSYKGIYPCCSQSEICPRVGIDFHGSDISKIGNVDSWKDCSVYCRTIPTCQFWTYVTDGRDLCLAKSSDSKTTSNSHRTSGQRSCGEDE